MSALVKRLSKPHLNGRMPASRGGSGQCGSRMTLWVSAATAANSNAASVALLP